MHRLTTLLILSVCICGCSHDPTKPTPHVVTERDARLISIARQAATAEGFSLTDTIYQVRPDGGGWIVKVDRAPGYTGVGEPSVVPDGTFFVKLTGDEQVSELLSHGRSINLATRPKGAK